MTDLDKLEELERAATKAARGVARGRSKTLESLTKRFWPKVKISDGCWEWVAGLGSGGYGNIYGGQRAHRVSWRIHFGEIPAGLFVLHKCDNRKCVRPDHLFLGTHDDNMADKARKGRQHGCGVPRKTHCKWGHELVDGNLYFNSKSGDRVCKACATRRNRARPSTRGGLMTDDDFRREAQLDRATEAVAKLKAERDALRAEVEGLKAQLATAREDALEEVAKMFDGYVMVIESKFDGHRTECDMGAAATMVRALKKTTKGGGA